LESLASQYDFTDGTPFSYSDPRFNPRNMGATAIRVLQLLFYMINVPSEAEFMIVTPTIPLQLISLPIQNKPLAQAMA
jgi:hypothetical protein